MSKRHDIEHRLQSLGEIKEIMGAMKNLSLIEIRKLTRVLGTQSKVVTSLEAAAADFLHFYPQFMVPRTHAEHVYIVIGSERGFCGDFNDVVVQRLESHQQEASILEPRLISVGYRLSTRLAHHPGVVAQLSGPTVAEEVGSVLMRVMDTIRQRHTGRDALPLALTALYHEDTGGKVQELLPLPPCGHDTVRFAFPPVLNLSPHDFFAALVDHYLYAALHEMFYTSLMVENHRRLQHMESAIQRIERESTALALTRNSLRQEEITEDIEVILLSAEAMQQGP
jgi:F-type H+-transporting ATPase subunit gamma